MDDLPSDPPEWRDLGAAAIEQGELGVETAQDSLRQAGELQQSVEQWSPAVDPEWGRALAPELDRMIDQIREVVSGDPVEIPTDLPADQEATVMKARGLRLQAVGLHMQGLAVLLRTRKTLQQKLGVQGSEEHA